MKAIDTNIIVRFLVGDDEQQSQKAYHFFKKAESEKNEFFVPLLVILEVVWVLESVYPIERGKIVRYCANYCSYRSYDLSNNRPFKGFSKMRKKTAMIFLIS
jgi:predicted nucleic acid-binding protein